MIRLNTLHLKIIATALMVMDHVGYILVPTSEPIYYLMRILGRVAAPLFWFCFTEGYRHTSNKNKYAMRLAMAACVMAIGNTLIGFALKPNVSISPLKPNIFLTIFLMLFAVESFTRIKNAQILGKIKFALVGLLFCLIAGIHAEYGWIAVIAILCFYFIGKWKIVAFVITSLAICLIEKNLLQVFMILAALLINAYVNEKPRKRMKWFFYVFYPVHLWFLMLIEKLI